MNASLLSFGAILYWNNFISCFSNFLPINYDIKKSFQEFNLENKYWENNLLKIAE